MKPKPVAISWSTFDGPFGKCSVARSEKGLCAVSLRGPEGKLLEQFKRVRGVELVKAEDCMPEARRQLLEYFGGKRTEFDLPLDLFIGTKFQQQVWRGLCRIPFGETRSYRWLAGQVKRPGASRAVGQANGRNPIPVIVPCHRIIYADGTIGGYTGGLRIKRKLLAIEGIEVREEESQ